MSDSVHLVHRATSGLLPTSTFNMVDEGGAVIGFAQVRHRASHSASLPPEAANHVYLQIAEPYRGQGHGKRLELSPEVGDGSNREGGISWGCLTTSLLH
jgi:hypothetical protein